MANTVLPLSSDIYLEVDGKKVAVVQSYTTRATRTSREIEAFGENEPVATIAGANKYTLELSRLYATDEAISDGINFYDLNDFSLVICKPDKRIIYSQCRWSSIEEAGKLGDPAAEKVTIIARKRWRSQADGQASAELFGARAGEDGAHRGENVRDAAAFGPRDALAAARDRAA